VVEEDNYTPNWLHLCQTPQGARDMIKYVFDMSSPAEVETVVKTFFRITSRTMANVPRSKVKKQGKSPAKMKKGGHGPQAQQAPQSHIVDKHDIRVYRLLELADTCHDFFNDNYATPEELEVEVAEYIAEYKYELPVGLTPNSFVKSKIW